MGGGIGAEMDMGIGILDGGVAAPLNEGIDRLVRGRGRKNVDHNDPFGVGGGVGGATSGTGMLLVDLVGECVYVYARDDPGAWYPVCGRGLCLDDVDRVRGRGEEGEAPDADAVRGLG